MKLGELRMQWKLIGILSIIFPIVSACVGQQNSQPLIPQSLSDDSPEMLEGRIAYITSDNQIWVMDGDGENKQLLVDDDFYKRDIAWAPNRSKLAYIARRRNDEVFFESLWVIDADGQNHHQLTDEARYAGFGWRSNSHEIGYTEFRTFEQFPGDAHYFDINTVTGTMTETLNSTTSPFPPVSIARHSPDKTKVAYVPQDSNSLYIANLDGTEIRELASGDAGGLTCLEWSSNGTQLAFCPPQEDQKGQSTDLFTINIDGSNLRRLTNEAEQHEVSNISNISWSPDDRWIAFILSHTGVTNQLCLIESQSEDQICFGSYWIGSESPLWSPDSTRIAIVTDKVEPNTKKRIYTFSITGDIVSLTDDSQDVIIGEVDWH